MGEYHLSILLLDYAVSAVACFSSLQSHVRDNVNF